MHIIETSKLVGCLLNNILFANITLKNLADRKNVLYCLENRIFWELALCLVVWKMNLTLMILGVVRSGHGLNITVLVFPSIHRFQKTLKCHAWNDKINN